VLVDPPHNGNNLSFDGGDEKSEGRHDNTVVNVRPHDSGLPASPQYPAILLPFLKHIDAKLIDLCNGDTYTYGDDRAHTDNRFTAIKSKIDSLLQKIDTT
jgi:hypothetical protein